MTAIPADFAEWLSPILVKELRQGMRRRIFVASFILLQVAMVFLAVASLAAAQVSAETDDYTVIFWIIVALPLIVTMPASGLSAVGEERRAGTLELMFLTQLSSRRIFLGKWFAIVTQTALLVTTVVPYLVLRYYLGGVNLELELGVLVGLMLGSAVLSGVAVGLSPLPALLVRVLASVAILVLLIGGANTVASMAYGGMVPSMARSSPWVPWLIFLIFGTFLFAIMMEFGSSRIAPPAENHSTSIRLIGLASVGLSALFRWFGGRGAGGISLELSDLLVMVVCAGLLCESFSTVPAVYWPFVRRGFLGRLAGRFLYPGWASAVNYTALIFAIRIALILGQRGGIYSMRLLHQDYVLGFAHLPPLTASMMEAAVRQVVRLGALIFPLLPLRLLWPKTARPVAGYFIIQSGAAVIFAIALIVQEITKNPWYKSAAEVLPPCAALSFFEGFDSPQMSLDRVMPAALVTLATLLSLVLMATRGAWKEVRQYEALAAEPLEPR